MIGEATLQMLPGSLEVAAGDGLFRPFALGKKAIENKEKANFFAHKGGQMRLVAKRMRAAAEEAGAVR